MADDVTETSQTVAAGQLRAFIERIERLEEEKKTIADETGAESWAQLLAPIIDAINARPDIHVVRQYGSRTGPL